MNILLSPTLAVRYLKAVEEGETRCERSVCSWLLFCVVAVSYPLGLLAKTETGPGDQSGRVVYSDRVEPKVCLLYLWFEMSVNRGLIIALEPFSQEWGERQ
jgi:hypothetical protein